MNKEHLLTTDRKATLAVVLKQLGRNEKDFEDDVRILEKWLTTQKHLPQITPRSMLECYLINCKFSIEKCKQKLDTYYTLKTVIPDVFKNKHPRLPHMKKLFDAGVSIPLPQLTKDNERVVLLNFFDPNDDKIWDLFFANSFTVLDIRIREDICTTTIVVVDLANFNFNMMVKLSPVMLKKVDKAFLNGYAGRMKAFHFINCPSIIDSLVTLMKSVLSEKLSKRIFIHSSVEELYEHVSRDIFPKEYGGTAPFTFSELIKLWKEKIVDNYKLFDQLEEIKVNESLRAKPLNNDEVLGFHGNFKKLNID